jgi:3-isopropylmalate/(R)-2-methylmalate dehydratase small subunit
VIIDATGDSESFEINGYKKNNMVNGFDDIDYLQSMKEEIGKFETTRPF